MSSSIERERRYLVTAFDPSILEGRPPNMITQGYFDVLGERSFRVRLIERPHLAESLMAVITLKSGVGEVRNETEQPIAAGTASVMLSATPYVLKKHRYFVDGFELDVFQGNLKGIVLLEYEARDDEAFPPLPEWVHSAIDVTDSLTNLHLARLATELPGHALTAVSHFLEPRLPKIVLTGGPCSGKSTLIREIEQLYGDSVHCVHEVATILISQVGLRPDPNDPVAYAKFQRTLYMVQRAFEDAAEVQALRDGKKILVLDRGTVDAAAYMPHSTTMSRSEAYETMVGRGVASEIKRYAHVIVLAVPPHHVYDAHRTNNTARSEDYEQAVELERRTAKAWRLGDRHGGNYVRHEAWEDKRNAVLSDIEQYVNHP